MEKQEFTTLAKENNYNIYSVNRITSGKNKGYRISFSKQLNQTTQTVEETKDFWEESLSDILNKFFA